MLGGVFGGDATAAVAMLISVGGVLFSVGVIGYIVCQFQQQEALQNL